MQLRRAEAADEERLAGIRRRAILALAVPALSAEQAEQWAAQAAPDRIARAVREHEVWVAVEGDVAGWVEVDGDRVAALYVSPSCAGRGVGTALLARAEAAIRDAGHAAARLEASRNALGFYLRRGYVRSGPPDAEGAHPLRKDLAAAGLPHSSRCGNLQLCCLYGMLSSVIAYAMHLIIKHIVITYGSRIKYVFLCLSVRYR